MPLGAPNSPVGSVVFWQLGWCSPHMEFDHRGHMKLDPISAGRKRGCVVRLGLIEKRKIGMQNFSAAKTYLKVSMELWISLKQGESWIHSLVLPPDCHLIFGSVIPRFHPIFPWPVGRKRTAGQFLHQDLKVCWIWAKCPQQSSEAADQTAGFAGQWRSHSLHCKAAWHLGARSQQSIPG